MGDASRLLGPAELALGVPLDWHVVDCRGRLLARQGAVIRSQQQLSSLMKYQPLFLEDKRNDFSQFVDVLNPFLKLENVAINLERIYLAQEHSNIKKRRAATQLLPRLASCLINLCEYDLDALIGATHHFRGPSYAITHSLHNAVLAYALGRYVRIDDAQMQSLVGAALSANISMYELQNRLFEQKERLSPGQEKKVKQHPLHSAVMLKHHGISDESWLGIVLLHHENVDGTGYPRKRRGDEIDQLARMLALADRYHAMVSSRRHRQGLLPAQALKRMVAMGGKELDKKLVLQFIKTIGVFPPGSCVKLANGDTAIVERLSRENSSPPRYWSVWDKDNIAYAEPKLCDAQMLDQQIKNVCAMPVKQWRSYRALWGYPA